MLIYKREGVKIEKKRNISKEDDMSRESLVILIPAFNEEPRIGPVLEVVCQDKRKKRIVVIDDGSSDRTAKCAERYSVEVLRHDFNRGKGAALQTGITHVGYADYWLFLDADLINLKEIHIEALLHPLKNNPDTGMTIGIFQQGGKVGVDLAQKYFSILNGQRGLSGKFVQLLPDLSWAKFGVEIFLTKIALYQGIKIVYPVLSGLTHHTKEGKLGFYAGFCYRLQMYRECLYTLFNWKKYL